MFFYKNVEKYKRALDLSKGVFKIKRTIGLGLLALVTWLRLPYRDGVAIY